MTVVHLYQKFIGMRNDLSGPSTTPLLLECQDDGSDQELCMKTLDYEQDTDPITDVEADLAALTVTCSGAGQ